MTTKPALKKTNSYKDVEKAKIAFIVGLLDISWRLAAVFLSPVLVGVILDQVYDNFPYTVAGTILGIILAVAFIIKQALEANKNV